MLRIPGLVELYPSVGDYIGLLDEFFAKSRSWVFKTTLPNPYYWAGMHTALPAIRCFHVSRLCALHLLLGGAAQATSLTC